MLILFFPSSPPSFAILSNAGITRVNNWITIEAVMYGLIDIANIENLVKAPPDIISINPAIPFEADCIYVDNVNTSTPGAVI